MPSSQPNAVNVLVPDENTLAARPRPSPAPRATANRRSSRRRTRAAASRGVTREELDELAAPTFEGAVPSKLGRWSPQLRWKNETPSLTWVRDDGKTSASAPAEVKRDKPSIPDVIPGGSPRNPMGVAAMTLSGGEYAIHGTNVPGSVGGFVSYGCIRMLNPDITDLYSRVSVGTTVVVTR